MRVRSMKIVYRLDEVTYYCFDEKDSEDVEERIILGFYSSLENLKNAIESYIKYGISKDKLFITSYFDNFTYNQKYVYYLTHEYSIVDSNGEYIMDYEYIFRPYSNKKKCKMLMEKLKNDEKYAYNANRDYKSQPPDGFYIGVAKLDATSNIPKDYKL